MTELTPQDSSSLKDAASAPLGVERATWPESEAAALKSVADDMLSSVAACFLQQTKRGEEMQQSNCTQVVLQSNLVHLGIKILERWKVKILKHLLETLT
jgi:hypothetical protein